MKIPKLGDIYSKYQVQTLSVKNGVHTLKMEPIKRINLFIIYIQYTSINGWFRLLKRWYGIHWKLKDANMLFSERYGHTKTYVIGKWRFKILPPTP